MGMGFPAFSLPNTSQKVAFLFALFAHATPAEPCSATAVVSDLGSARVLYGNQSSSPYMTQERSRLGQTNWAQYRGRLS